MKRARSATAVAVLLALASTCAIAAADGVGTAGFGSRSLEAGMSCGECTLIVDTLQAVSKNATDMQELVQVLDAVVCDKEFANSSSLKALCDALVKDVVDALPKIVAELDSLAWPVADGVCSVFVPVCSEPCCKTATEPEQIRLALTGDMSEVAVSWTTLNATATSTVQWSVGTSQPPFAHSSDGSNNTRTYTYGGWVGTLHNAVISGLEAGQTVSYRVGDDAGGWSDVLTYTTLPANAGTSARPLKVAQLGDTGFGTAGDATIAAIVAGASKSPPDFDLILFVGDIGYADGYMPHWDVFLNKISSLSVPIMTTPGNHEVWFDFGAYRNRFFMPQAAPGKLYYSFDFGPLHIAMLNTESPIDTPEMDNDQAKWLAADLASADANRANVPFVITAGHRPLYCSNPGNKIQCTTFAALLRATAEDLLHANHVDIHIQCHEHDMERSWPTYKGTPTAMNYSSPSAPVYVVNGAGGNREGNSHFESTNPWSAWSSGETGYGMLRVSSSSALSYDFVASNGTVLDSFTITK